MSRTVTYYLALNSPWSLMGAARLGQIAAMRGAAIDVCPVDIMRVFRESGGQPLSQRPKARQDYRLWEMARWTRRLGIELLPKPDPFPVDERLGAACVLALKADAGDALGLTEALGRALWADNRDIATRAVVADVLGTTLGEAAARALLQAAEEEADRWEAERQRLTDAALAAGVFGVPTYIVDDEPFWGQDRLDFVAEALETASGA